MSASSSKPMTLPLVIHQIEILDSN